MNDKQSITRSTDKRSIASRVLRHELVYSFSEERENKKKIKKIKQKRKINRTKEKEKN